MPRKDTTTSSRSPMHASTPAGLSGATSQEAVTWGKVDPEQLPDTVVCYTDSTIALPIMTAYALSRQKPRKLRRLYDRRGEMLDRLSSDFSKNFEETEGIDAVRHRITASSISRRSSRNRHEQGFMSSPSPTRRR